MVSGAGHDAMILAEEIACGYDLSAQPQRLDSVMTRRNRLKWKMWRGNRMRIALLDQLASSTSIFKRGRDVHNLGQTRSAQTPIIYCSLPTLCAHAAYGNEKLHGDRSCRSGDGGEVRAIYGRIRGRRRTGCYSVAAFHVCDGGRTQGGSRREAKHTRGGWLCLFAGRRVPSCHPCRACRAG